MASYDNRTNVGFGRVTYPDQLRHSMFIDADGAKHAVVGYAKAHNYVVTSEQIVEFRHSPGIAKIELHGDHGTRDEPVLLPWGYSAHDRPHVSHGDNNGSPWSTKDGKLGHLPTHDHSRGSPRIKDADDSSRFVVHDYSKGSPRSKDANDSSRFVVHDYIKGSPRSKDAIDSSRFVVHDHSKGSPRSTDTTDTSRLAAHIQNKGSPRIKDAMKDRDHYYNLHNDSKNNNYDDEDDEVICEDGVCYVKKRGGSKPNNHHLKQEDHDKGHGYYPKKDSYHGTPYDHDKEKHKGTSYVPPYTVPFTTQPRTDTYPSLNGPKPIKTRIDADQTKYNGSPRKELDNYQMYNKLSMPLVNSPVISSPKNSNFSAGMQPKYSHESPRKDHLGYQEINHGKASPRGGKIDSKEAARKYNGVLLSS